MNWSNQLFEEVRSSKPYQNCQSSWREQRAFLGLSVEALELAGHPLAKDIAARLDAIEPAIPDVSGMPLPPSTPCPFLNLHCSAMGRD